MGLLVLRYACYWYGCYSCLCNIGANINVYFTYWVRQAHIIPLQISVKECKYALHPKASIDTIIYVAISSTTVSYHNPSSFCSYNSGSVYHCYPGSVQVQVKVISYNSFEKVKDKYGMNFRLNLYSYYMYVF